MRVLDNSGGILEREVKTGIRGSGGNIEITDGLIEGERIITFVETE